MPDKINKQYITAKVEKKDGKMVAVATDQSEDRHGEKLDIKKWDLREFKKNPVMQAGHDYKPESNIGAAENIRLDGARENRLIFNPVFHGITRLSWEIGEMFKKGFLKTFSVGFIRHIEKDDKGNWKTDRKGNPIVKSYELLEISAVPVPANPHARVIQMSFDKIETDAKEIDKLKNYLEGYKTVIRYKKHPLSPKDNAWDGPIEVTKATIDQLKLMSTWFDKANDDVKAGYKLPHHKALSPNNTVWRGVAAAMAALLGARGGVKIPTDDRKGVYNHLAKHYTEFDEKAPEFKEFRLEDLYKMHKKGIIRADEKYLLTELVYYYSGKNKFDKYLYKLIKLDKNNKKDKKGRDPKEEVKSDYNDEQIILRALQNVARNVNLALNKFKKKL